MILNNRKSTWEKGRDRMKEEPLVPQQLFTYITGPGKESARIFSDEKILLTPTSDLTRGK